MDKKIAGLAPLFLLMLATGLLLLSGCSATVGNARLFSEAYTKGMRHRIVTVDGFAMTAFTRLQDASKPIHLYVEGDGKAWVSRAEPSADPTPRHAIGLQLALGDPFANVIYLARPCQFSLHESPACTQALWTSQRFSNQVVNAMNAAVNILKAGHPDQPLELIGYSGGAAIVVLLASRRDDVTSLRSVAGNLDHEAFNRYHKVSPMPDSLNPIDVANVLRGLPQIHFSGADDTIVPSFIAESFTLKAGGCARIEVVEGAGHDSGWVEAWPTLLSETPSCKHGKKPGN